MTTIKTGKEARTSLQAGVNIVANAVKVTLGARGRNVTIRRLGKAPQITKDGVTVANMILSLPDPYEDMGAQMVKEAARQTMNKAGDGTTTATILTQAIFNAGIRAIDDELNPANPVDINNGIDKAVKIVVSSIASQSIQIEKDKKQLKRVAMISANGDEEIAEIVAEVVCNVGRNGIISIGKSKTEKTTVEMVDGMQIERGYLSPYFVTNLERGLAELESPYILLFDGKISFLPDIQPILDTILKNNASLLIIAEDVDGDAMATITTNVSRKVIRAAVIRAPFGGSESLEDIATITGGTVISEKKGHKLKNAPMDYLGKAESVRVSIDGTLIVGGKGNKLSIQQRIKNIESQMEDTTVEDQFRFERRLQRMSESVAIIFIGGHNDTEIGEKRDRADDAIKATQAAIIEGIVPGGGVAYIRASRELFHKIYKNHSEHGHSEFVEIDSPFNIGMKIVMEALEAPMAQIFQNAGIIHWKDVIANVSLKTGDFGYNVKTEDYEHFMESGIIDPAKVSRVALENAASAASILLTTEAAIVEMPQ